MLNNGARRRLEWADGGRQPLPLRHVAYQLMIAGLPGYDPYGPGLR